MSHELFQKVLYLREVKGLSFRQIGKETGIPRRKASKIYSGTWKEDNRPKRSPILALYHDLIHSWFNEIPSLKATQVFKRLKERGVLVSYRTVSKFTEYARKKKKDKVYWPLSFLPGEEGQVDWFFMDHPKLGKLYGFTIVLSYSRYSFAHIFCRSSFEFFIEGHIMAFSDFGGYPRCLRYDNLKSVVLKREPLQYNPSFLEFARHYGFEIRLCNPAAGNEKGRVERLIRSVRETFLNTAEHHQSLLALNEALHTWIHEKNETIHRATEAVPAKKKSEEKLKKLPEHTWVNTFIHPPKRSTKTGFVIFDTNFYSVPEYVIHESLILHTFIDKVDIYDPKGNRVASHPRCFERKQEIFNPIHRLGNKLSEKGKRDRIFALIQNMDPITKTFLEQNRNIGEDAHQTAYTIFKFLKDHSRGLILSLLREAMTVKNPKLKFLLSHLTRTEIKGDSVYPQNSSLLTIDYQPRPLEDYDKYNK